MAGGQVNIGIGFSVDKSGLSQMQSLFQQIANSAKEPGNQLNTGLQQAAATANKLDAILEKTFNTNLGTLNVTKFNQELSKSGMTLKSVQADLSKAGNQGATAYNRLSQAILGTNLQLKQSNKLLDDMATTMANTVKWGITSSIFNTITNSIQKAYTYSKQLNTSLNDIRIVTDKSADSMERFAEQANEAAKGMGASTLDYTNAALIYYQQGLTDSEVQARAETTIKAANVTGQTGEEVSEQLTAVWNGYKVTAEETEAYVDKLAAVAATTAADLEELSVGMSKVAAAANSMGVDFDDLNAQIATIVSVTRQAPESVGTALKTIYARLGDLKVDGVDEFGVKLGEVSAQMQQMGIQILDQNGDLRDMSSVIAEVAQKWTGWTEAQRQAAAVAMAGKRQYNNLIALFDNWDMYTDALNTSVEAVGTLQHQQDIYMESTAAKLKTLKATWQDLYDGIIDDDELNTGIEGLTNLVQVFDNFIDSFGGGIKSIGAFGAIVANIFNKQIAEAINAANQRQEIFKQNLALTKLNAEVRMNNVNQLGANATSQDFAVQANTEKQLILAEKIYNARIGLNQEQTNTLINYQKEIGVLEEEINLDNQRLSSLESKKILEKEDIDFIKQYSFNLEEINGYYEEQNQKLIISNEQLDQIKNDWDEITSDEIKALEVIEDINSLSSVLDANDKENWNILKNKLKTLTDIWNYNDDILDTIFLIKNANNEDLKLLKQKTSEAQKYANVYSNKSVNTVKQSNLQQEADEMLRLANNAKNVTQNIITATSALGTMAMAWSSVNSLIQTWNDESASFGDKLTQTFMALSFTLPMVISSFSKLNEAFGYTTGILETFQSISVKNSAISSLNAAGYEIEKKALAGKTKAEIEDYLVSQYLLTHEIKINGVRVTNIALLSKEQKAYLLDLMAKETDDEVTKKLTSSQLALNSAMLANPVTWVIAGLVALVAATAAYVSIQKKQLEQQLEINKANIEKENQIQSEIQANEDLYESYLLAKKAYEEGTGSRQDLQDATEKICDAYDIEISKLDILAAKHDKVTEAINKERKEDLKRGKESAEREQKSAEGTVVAKAQSLDHIGGKDYYAPDVSSGWRTEEDEQVRNIFKQTGIIDENDIWKGVITDPNDIESYVKLYDKLSKSIEKVENEMQPMAYTQSDYYKNTKQWLEDMSEEINAYKESIKNVKSFDTKIEGLKFNFNDISNIQEYNIQIEKLKSHFIELGYSEKEAVEMAKEYGKDISDIAEQAQFSNDISQITGINEEQLNKYIDNLSDFKKEIIFSGQIDFDTIRTLDDLDEKINIIQNQIDQEDLSVVVSLRAKIASDKKLTKSQLKEMAGEESTLAEDYEVELSDFDNQAQLKQLDTLNKIANKKIENNNEYIASIHDTLDEQRKQLEEDKDFYEKEIQLLEERKKAAQTNHVSFLFTDEDAEQLDEYTEKLEYTVEELDYLQEYLHFDEFNDINFDNIIAGIDGIINEANILKDLAELVGENWIIASKDIAEFGQNFPEILAAQENYNFLQDGSVQLTEQGVAAFNQLVAARQADLEASNESYQLELQRQIDMEQAKADYYTSQAEALKAYLNNEANAKETEAKMDKNLTDYKKQLMDITGTNDEELNKTIQENLGLTNVNAESNTKDIYDYWCSVGEAAALAGNAYDAKSFDPPGFKGGGKAPVRTTSFKPRETEGTSIGQLEKEDIESLIATYEKAAEEASNKAATLISKKAGMGAATKAATNAMERAAAGKGGKESKSKGGGGKDKKDKDEKKYRDEFDRYWEIKKAIDAVDLALKRLAKDQKNLYGTQLIDSLKIQNNLLEQQKAHYDALWEAQEQEAAELRAQLGTMGLVFDASGAITNYAAATTQALADYNAAIQQYNAGLIDDTALQVYEKSYENFKKLLERYDTLYYKEIQDTIDKIDDLRREQLANNLKAWEVKIELKLNLKELKRGWIDFIKEINEDFQKVYKDLRVEAQRLKDDAKTYIGDDGGVATTINAIHDVTAEIDKMQAGGTSTMFESISQAQEKLKELNDTLQDNAKGLRDLWKAAWDNYLDGIDEVSDRFEDLMDQFERMDDELEFQGQLIELLYGEKAYEMMDKLYKGQERSLGNQVQSVKTQMDMWERLWRESGATMENQSSWTEDQKKYYDEWTSAQKKLNDLVIDYIKLLKDDYLNTIEKILTELERGLTGSSLADMKTEWERITEYSDKYLDDVEQAYEAQKLANKIDEEIAKTNDVKKQQKLQAFRDKEIKYLREKEHLTQYDLDAAEARYQIALKEMALEDARNNKTSMKLVRNEQGNWSYQYLADEEETASKQQELLDAYNDLYQLASDAYEANLEALQTLQEKYLESAKEIYEDETLSEQEKEQKLLELRQWYFQQYALLAEENTLYRNDLATSAAALLLEIYNEDEEAYQAMTDAERQLVDDLVSANIDDYMDLENKIKDNYKNIGDASKVLMSDTRKDWNSSAQQIADNWINSSNNVRSEVLSAHAQIQQATDDYQTKVDWVAAAVERDFGPDGITGAIWEASYATDDLKNTTIDLVNESIPYLESLKQAVDEIEAAWNSVKDAIEAAIGELERYISLEAHYAQQQAENRAKEAAAQAAEAAKSSNSGGSSSGGGITGGGSTSNYTYRQYADYYNGQRQVTVEKYDSNGNMVDARNYRSDSTAVKDHSNGGFIDENYLRKKFNTGGYTGSWNGGDTDGRVAVLHQKELVLNKEDTSNFLSGIQMLRDMTSTNGSISNAIMQAVANMASSLGNIRANRLNGTTMVNETTENNGNIFNIQAEFPNANDANEIRQALLSLPNLASQYIARNRR